MQKYPTSLLLIALSFCLHNISFGQTSANEELIESLSITLDQGDFQSALNQSDSLLNTHSSTTDIILLTGLTWVKGQALLKQKKVDKAHIMLDSAYHLANTETPNMPIWLRAKCASSLGFTTLYFEQNVAAAETLMTEGLVLCEISMVTHPYAIGSAYYNLGVLYQAIGENREAVKYGKKACEVFERGVLVNKKRYINGLLASRNLLGSSQANLQDPGALETLKKAQNLAEEVYQSKRNPLSHNFWYTIGICHSLQNETQESKQDFENAIADFKVLAGTDTSLFVSSAQAYIGDAFYKEKNYTLAHEFAEKSIRTWYLAGGERSPDVAAFTYESARALIALGRFDEAQIRLDTALAIYGFVGKVTDAPQEFIYLSGLFDALAAYSDLYKRQYQEKRKTEVLEKAISYGELAAEAFYAIRSSSLDESTVMSFSDKASASLETLLSVYFLVDSLQSNPRLRTEAYNLAERLRGFVLLRSLAKDRQGLPRDNQEIESLDLQKVQSSLLKPNQTLLQYYVGNQDIYLFAVRNNDFKIIKIPNSKVLESLITDLITSITDYYSLSDENPRATPLLEKKSNTNYLITARALYQKLLHPIALWLDNKPNGDLIIVPDGTLSQVPFEALLTDDAGQSNLENIDFTSLPYLLKQHNVRYGWSSTTIYYMSQPKPPCTLCPNTIDYIGFAPFNDNTQEQGSPLPAISKSVKEVSSLYGDKGRYYQGEEALKSTFLTYPTCTKYLLIGSHAGASKYLGTPFILFLSLPSSAQKTDTLWLTEIYDAPRFCRLELVVLSACQTGVGKTYTSEGAISLGRSFASVGAKSVVYTLWSVKDEATGQLNRTFFEGIKKSGNSKTAALANAKRGMLGKSTPNKDLSKWSHPFFWAGYILAGDGE